VNAIVQHHKGENSTTFPKTFHYQIRLPISNLDSLGFWDPNLLKTFSKSFFSPHKNLK
jgi:hypothetical protein